MDVTVFVLNRSAQITLVNLNGYNTNSHFDRNTFTNYSLTAPYEPLSLSNAITLTQTSTAGNTVYGNTMTRAATGGCASGSPNGLEAVMGNTTYSNNTNNEFLHGLSGFVRSG